MKRLAWALAFVCVSASIVFAQNPPAAGQGAPAGGQGDGRAAGTGAAGLDFRWESPGAVMDRQDVHLVPAHQSVEDAIRPSNDFANLGILELGHGTARLGEGRKLGVAAISCRTTTEA